MTIEWTLFCFMAFQMTINFILTIFLVVTFHDLLNHLRCAMQSSKDESAVD